MEKTCPNHPDSSSIVPCLGCGRAFCRICHPVRGIGQYCPRCFDESLLRLEEKKAAGLAERFRERILCFGRSGSGKVGEVGIRAGRAPRKAVDAASRKPGLGNGSLVVKENRGTLVRAVENARRWAEKIPGLPGKAWRSLAGYWKRYFPFEIVRTGRGEGMPPLAASWHKLLLSVLCGALVWTVVVAAAKQRTTLLSVAVSFAVAAAVAWALGSRFDVQTAVVTTMLALLALVIGDVVVLLLFRAGVIKELDVGGSEIAGVFYRSYFLRLLVWRLLPAAVIAFLVGLWPLPRRPRWRGFRSEGRVSQDSSSSRGRASDKSS